MPPRLAWAERLAVKANLRGSGVASPVMVGVSCAVVTGRLPFGNNVNDNYYHSAKDLCWIKCAALRRHLSASARRLSAGVSFRGRAAEHHSPPGTSSTEGGHTQASGEQRRQPRATDEHCRYVLHGRDRRVQSVPMMMATRRFSARPAALPLSATGASSPRPRMSRFAGGMPTETSTSATDWARWRESCWL